MASAADLSKTLADQGVRYVFGFYVDVHGVPKSKCVPVTSLESMADGSELYTVGALEGMGELGHTRTNARASRIWTGSWCCRGIGRSRSRRPR